MYKEMYAICGTHQGSMRGVEYHPYIYEFLPHKGDAILYRDSPSVDRNHLVLTLLFQPAFTLFASSFSEPVLIHTLKILCQTVVILPKYYRIFASQLRQNQHNFHRIRETPQNFQETFTTKL